MRKPLIWIIILFVLISLTSCEQTTRKQKELKVGLLITDTINDQVWGSKGYKGLLQIHSQFGVDVFYKEGINTKELTKHAVDEFVDKGVNLIFGHGSEYDRFFNVIAHEYPEVHFINFNGNSKNENVTSLNFKSNAMGFFGGMVAGKMTETDKIGIIAAYEWQPEVDGFYEGAAFQNQDIDIEIRFVQNWDNETRALAILDDMLKKGVDVIYPAGDGYNVSVIEKMKEKGLYAIGYVSDQLDLGEGTVLTSTVQHVDRLYVLMAKKFLEGELDSGNLYFDFQDEVISLGSFSPVVDDVFQEEISTYIKEYKKTGDLPNE